MFRKNLFTYSLFAALAVSFLPFASYTYAGMPAYENPAGRKPIIIAAAAVSQPDVDEEITDIVTPDDTPDTVQGPNAPAVQPQPAQTPRPAVAPRPAAAPAPGTVPQPPAAPAPAVPAPLAPAGPARVAPSAGGSSFFFDDADVFEVVQTVFGEVLRVNYIIDPQVKGRVNFRTTTPIPRDRILPIMEIILRLNGIAVVEESGLYRIIPIGGIAKEPAPIRFGKDPNAIELKGTAVLQIVPLTFINSSEMSGILTPLLTQGGAIYDVTKKNILIIADTDANVKRLLQVVAMFDVDSYKDAAQPKIYVYPLQNSKAEHVAKILQQVLLGQAAPSSATSGSSVKTSTGQQPGATTPQRPVSGPTAPVQPGYTPGGAANTEPLVAPNTKIIADEVANSLVIFASPADYSVVRGAIKQIDTQPRQVMIEAMVASVTLTDNLTFGVKWNLNLDLNLGLTALTSHGVHLLGPLGFQNIGTVPDGSFGYTARDRSGNVRATIEALALNSKARILSSPNLLVADNREARIQVGSQIPIATSTTSTPLTATDAANITNTTTSTIQYKDVGTILKIKPQINDSGLVSLEVSQEVSSAATQTILGTSQFVISKNEVSTNLVVQDGQTIVIGGLVSETSSYSINGIPLLTKIPILGSLFGSTENDKLRQELIILLTPHVVRNNSEAEKMTSDYYELFNKLDKELGLKKRSKTTQSNQDESPSQTNGKAAKQTSPTKSDNKNGEKPVEKPYPLSPEEN